MRLADPLLAAIFVLGFVGLLLGGCGSSRHNDNYPWGQLSQEIGKQYRGESR